MLPAQLTVSMTHMRTVTVLWIPYDAYLTIRIRMLWLAQLTARILGQLPQCTALLQLIAWKVERRQHLIRAAFAAIDAQYHNLLCKFVQKASNCACKGAKAERGRALDLIKLLIIVMGSINVTDLIDGAGEVS